MSHNAYIFVCLYFSVCFTPVHQTHGTGESEGRPDKHAVTRWCREQCLQCLPHKSVPPSLLAVVLVSPFYQASHSHQPHTLTQTHTSRPKKWPRGTKKHVLRQISDFTCQGKVFLTTGGSVYTLTSGAPHTICLEVQGRSDHVEDLLSRCCHLPVASSQLVLPLETISVKHHLGVFIQVQICKNSISTEISKHYLA